MKKAALCAIVVIIFTMFVSQVYGVPPESPEAFVRRFFKEYLATFEKNYWFDKEKKLSQYFDRNLTSLFLKDEECKKKEQGICNLDFDPIIDAQDYDENIYSTLKVEKVGSASANRIKVTFRNLGTRTTVIYTLRPTEKGWRINNITYPQTHSTLVNILSQKMK